MVNFWLILIQKIESDDNEAQGMWVIADWEQVKIMHACVFCWGLRYKKEEKCSSRLHQIISRILIFNCLLATIQATKTHRNLLTLIFKTCSVGKGFKTGTKTFRLNKALFEQQNIAKTWHIPKSLNFMKNDPTKTEDFDIPIYKRKQHKWFTFHDSQRKKKPLKGIGNRRVRWRLWIRDSWIGRSGLMGVTIDQNYIVELLSQKSSKLNYLIRKWTPKMHVKISRR